MIHIVLNGKDTSGKVHRGQEKPDEKLQPNGHDHVVSNKVSTNSQTSIDDENRKAVVLRHVH